MPKQELRLDEINEDTWEDKEDEWLPYVRNNVIAYAFLYARYTMGMEDIPNFGRKNSSTLLFLANKHFNSLRDENDELMYTYTDPFMTNCARNSIKGGRCKYFIQYYCFEISDEVFIFISNEL